MHQSGLLRGKGIGLTGTTIDTREEEQDVRLAIDGLLISRHERSVVNGTGTERI